MTKEQNGLLIAALKATMPSKILISPLNPLQEWTEEVAVCEVLAMDNKMNTARDLVGLTKAMENLTQMLSKVSQVDILG
jgi:hypothetical protein